MSAAIAARKLAVFVLFVAAWCGARTANATIVQIQTTLGNIDVRMYDTATPLHVANMLSYINSNRYDGTFIHRSAKHQNGTDFVIQAGGYRINTSLFANPIPSGWSRIENFGFVTNEPGISNLRGTIALAKGSGLSSGTSEWFINLNDINTFLNLPPPDSNSFTVFGRVIGNGMTVADAVADLTRVGASAAGSAFNEVPVLDLDKVIAQQNIFNEDVVRLTDVFVRNLPAGDYDFNGTVNAADYSVWRTTFGSTTNAAADGNGNGVVDTADYVVWRNTFGQTSSGGGAGSGSVFATVPEMASGVLMLLAAPVLALYRRRPLK